MGIYFKNKKNLEKNICPYLSRSWIYLYNGERIVMIDKDIPEICLFQSDDENISVQMQNDFHAFVDAKHKIMKFILHLDRIWTEIF